MHTETEHQSRPLEYHPTTPGGIFNIAPTITTDDLTNYLSARLSHLYSMLAMTYGEAGESFRANNDDIQDGYMWACAALAEECRGVFSQITAAIAQ